MEKKESNTDLILPQHMLTYAGIFLELLTDRVNILWAEHLKNREKKNGKRDEKPNSGSDQ